MTTAADPLLQDPESKRAHSRKWTGIVLVFLVVMLGDGNRGLVLPTLAGYIHENGGGANKLALSNAGFSLGRMLVAPWFGMWMDRRPMGEVLSFTLAVCIVCNLVYMSAGSFGSRYGEKIGLWCIIISRSVLGIGACVLGIGRGYISKHTSKAQRTACISLLCAVQFMGFTAFSSISLLHIESFLNAVGLNQYTFPGATLCLLYSTMLAVVLLMPSNLWDDPLSLPITKSTQKPKAEYGTPLTATAGAVAVDMPEESGGSGLVLPLTFVLLNFAVRAVLATQETLGPCIIHYLYNGASICHAGASTPAAHVSAQSEKDAVFFIASFFTIVGIGGMLWFLAIYFFSPYTTDRWMLLSGLVATTVGLAVMLDWNDPSASGEHISLERFDTGFAVAWAVGYPLTQTVAVSALSKSLDPKDVGKWMGYQASAGSAGRVLGPLLSGYLYQTFHEDIGFLPFLLCFIISVICVGGVVWFWDRLPSN